MIVAGKPNLSTVEQHIMEIQFRALSSVLVLLLIIFGVAWFKHIGLLKEEYGRMCSTLITKVTLPAVILLTLTHADFRWGYGKMNFLLMAASFLCLGLGWVIARAFHVDRSGTAAVILVAGFSSSSVLGVSLIGELFPSNKQAVVDTVVFSSLGMAPLIITVGTMIALYYGAHDMTPKQRRRETLSYFRSPIFVALVAGIALGAVTTHDNWYVHSILDGLEVVSAGNTLMALLAVGLFLQFQDFRSIAVVAACVAFVNLVMMPLLMMPPAHVMGLEHWEIEILALEGAMPPTAIAVVLCDAYGADARFAAKLAIATIIGSVFTIPIVFLFGSLL